MQLTRQARVGELWRILFQVGSAHAVNVELGTLKRAQKLLLGALEEVQPLDGSLALALWLSEPGEMRTPRA